MPRRLWLAGFSLAVVIGLSGCPVTDDYYIEAATSPAKAGTPAGGSDSGGGGSASQGGVSAQTSGGTEAPGGEASTDQAGAAGAVADCVPKTERCNGHDDDCDGLSDDGACGTQGTFGCFGFTLGDRQDHGYMLCSGNKRDWSHAEEACAAQDMRLAWVETETENEAISAKINAVGNVTEVLLGGTDQADEGDWYWSGGDMFWKGDADGYAVDDAFEAWAESVPNNTNNEDCLVLVPSSTMWGDRTCTASYAYLCEEREPAE